MHYTIFAGAYFTISFPREYVLARARVRGRRTVRVEARSWLGGRAKFAYNYAVSSWVTN